MDGRRRGGSPTARSRSPKRPGPPHPAPQAAQRPAIWSAEVWGKSVPPGQDVRCSGRRHVKPAAAASRMSHSAAGRGRRGRGRSGSAQAHQGRSVRTPARRSHIGGRSRPRRVMAPGRLPRPAPGVAARMPATRVPKRCLGERLGRAGSTLPRASSSDQQCDRDLPAARQPVEQHEPRCSSPLTGGGGHQVARASARPRIAVMKGRGHGNRSGYSVTDPNARPARLTPR